MVRSDSFECKICHESIRYIDVPEENRDIRVCVECMDKPIVHSVRSLAMDITRLYVSNMVSLYNVKGVTKETLDLVAPEVYAFTLKILMGTSTDFYTDKNYSERYGDE